MTNNEIRIAVAEACGFKRHGPNGWVMGGTFYALNEEAEDEECCGGIGGGYTPGLPNYPQDLNACHEMEKTIIGLHDTLQYLHFLSPVHSEWTLATSTARQRCEAFLQTKGLWKGETK